ncbi:MAG TPA: hypothetical protein VKB95_13460 [Chitinophagaceae bacterium]|nr:hypothetical protein [Chitinophagaceae bacterium]
MHKIIVNIKSNGKGCFALEIRNKTIGHVIVERDDNELKVLDTVVLVGRYLPLIGKLLLQGIVKYARLHDLKIVAIPKFVQQLLSSDLASCPDVWQKA